MAEERDKKFESYEYAAGPKENNRGHDRPWPVCTIPRRVPIKNQTGTKPTGSKPYLGKSRPSEITKGLDGTTNPSLMCHYCNGSTGHELDNCGKLQ